MRRSHLALLLLIASNTVAQPATSQPPAAPATQPVDQSGLHLTQRLGVRVANVAMSFKLVDRVVLVPDAATYLDEIRKWTPSARWPILIEDDTLAPMFVRRFKPAEVIRRAPHNAPLPADPAALRKMLEETVVSALGGDPATQTALQLFDAAKYRPPGVVVASTADPAWTAALALAAGHAQPLIWVDSDFGPVDGVMDDASARLLASQIGTGIDAIHPAVRSLDDAIDVITLCRNVPVAANVTLPDEQRLVKAGQFADGPVALTDFIGRNVDGRRYAFTGWIFGDETRCAYMAMCALFLHSDSISLLNSYGKDGEFGSYHINDAQQAFAAAGYNVNARAGETDMSEAGWSRAIAGGISSDVVWMNSGGNADYFILHGQAVGRPGDVPVLNQPAAVHLIHSWALRSPSRGDTVGGRWLQHGAYAMVGSCFEPFLTAFVRPGVLAARCLGAAPFLIAARRWQEDGFSEAWRVVTIGDPLMLIVRADGMKITRIAQKADYGENLLDRARTLMKKADAGNDANACAEAIRLLDLLGQDNIALQMWTLAQQKKLNSGPGGGGIASAILPVLFRARDAEGFAAAWNEGGPKSPLMFDMLWSLMGPRLGGPPNPDMLMMMEFAVRSDLPAFDAAKLAPALERAFGKARVAQFLQREIARTKDPEQQRQLREIAGRY